MTVGSISLAFADGEYQFRLGLAQIEELQRKCGVGIGGLCARLFAGRYKIADEAIGVIAEAQFHMADILEPIRQGLIGGGDGLVDGQPVKVTPLLANKLIENYVVGAPIVDAWTLSTTILTALMEGPPPSKKAEPPAAAALRKGKARRASITTEPLQTAP